MPTLTKFIARHETVKQRAAVPAYRAVARANVFLPGPRVFANSFPKAGTHLLSTLLGELPRMMFSGVHRAEGDYVEGDARRDGANLDWRRLRRTLERVNKGQYATGHFPYVPGLSELLDDLGYRSLLMIRDPRDVVVSAQHYVPEDERIAATIAGFGADEHGRGQASIGERLERFVPWLTTPGVLVVRFENLIGAAGGGSREAQERTVADVARHAGRALDPARVAAVADRVWSDRSSTFRQGHAGGWRERLTPEHVRLFKEHAGRALIELGYESDLDW